MNGFDTFVVVDWSAGEDRGPHPKKDAIWIGVVRDGVVEKPEYCRNRNVAEAWLTGFLDTERTASRRVLAAFDFPFGYPKGFVGSVTGSDDPLKFWAWLEARVTDNDQGRNNRYDIAEALNAGGSSAPGPFWGKPQTWADRYPGIPFTKVQDGVDFSPFGEFRTCERFVRDSAGKQTSSCFQLHYNPTVGGQVLTGLPVLERLRKLSGARIWPFEELDGAPVVFAEIWPALVEGAVSDATATGELRDRAQVRLLSRALSRLPQERLAKLMEVPEVAREEAWILGAGHHEELEALARLSPPRLQNDCFALPPGIDWTPVDQALDSLRARLMPVVAHEETSLAEADGCILAEPAIAARSNPPGANSAVDGYGFAHRALGTGDCKLPLVSGRAAAGAPFRGDVPSGHAIRILTGALLPAGVDTVVLEEDTSTDGAAVAFQGPLKPGANTRESGEDVRQGDQALAPGSRIGPPEMALLAATGVTRVSVYRRLRVGVLSTGSEIVEPGAGDDPSLTFDANRPMLLSLIRDWRMEAVDLGHVEDDRDKLRTRLNDGARQADVILTSGGASAGDEDHVSALLKETGSLADWRIALKPGRPLALGMWQGMPVFGLPGNPVAALVCTLIFARPALGLMSGEGWRGPLAFSVPAAFSKSKKPGRREYLRARLDEKGRAEVFKSEGSGRISGLAWADGLVEIGDEAQDIQPGDFVRYLPYAGFR